jgi:adenylate cyclase
MVCASVAHKIDSVETDRNMFDFEHQLTAFDYYIKGREIFFSRTRNANAESMQLIQKAITLDEHFARAYGFMAFLHVHEYRYGWSDNPQMSLDQALNFALKALAIDSFDFDSHWRLGITYLYRSKFDKALSEYEIARDKNPYHAGFLTEMAAALIFVERFDEALSQVKQAMRINPEHPEWFLAQFGWIFYELGEYDEAFRAFEKLNNPPAVFLPVVVATLIRLNRIDDARNVASDLLNSDLDFNLNNINYWPYKSNSRRIRLMDDLKLADMFS